MLFSVYVVKPMIVWSKELSGFESIWNIRYPDDYDYASHNYLNIVFWSLMIWS